MPMPKQLPCVTNDAGYQEESRLYAKRILECLKVSDIEKAIARAYLDGAQSSIRTGYMLAEQDYEKTIKYYKDKCNNNI